MTEKNPRAQRGSGSLVTVIVKTDITFKDAVATTMLFRTSFPNRLGSVSSPVRDTPHGSLRIVRRGA